MYDELVKRLREADEKYMCGECGLNLHTGATKNGVLFAEAADAIEELSKRVPPVPHGRLIDADALIADVRAHSESYFADDFAHEWVDVAPTIIPAEPFNNLSKPCKDDDDILICTKASPASLGIYKKAEEGET